MMPPRSRPRAGGPVAEGPAADLGEGFPASAAGGPEVVAEHRVPLVEELERRYLGLHPRAVNYWTKGRQERNYVDVSLGKWGGGHKLVFFPPWSQPVEFLGVAVRFGCGRGQI